MQTYRQQGKKELNSYYCYCLIIVIVIIVLQSSGNRWSNWFSVAEVVGYF